MSEFGPSFTPEDVKPPEVNYETGETRFGDKDELVSIMEHGTAHLMGRVEDFYPDIPHHRNVVEMAHVRMENGGSRNIAEFVTIDDDQGHHLEAIFKPVRGEAKKFYAENGLGHDYPREVGAYIVSEHFGLDLVPPTILREINGHVGSLQLFLPHQRYKLASEAMHRLDDEQLEAFMHSPDVVNLQLLDWITANADRHVENYMLKVDDRGAPEMRNNTPEVIAIDNGLAFNELFYRLKANRNDLPGPYLHLTKNNLANATVTTPLTESARECVERGVANANRLNEALLSLPDIESREIERMWQRIQALLESNVFLSGYNYKQHVEYPK